MTANRRTDPGKYQTGVAVGSERVPPVRPAGGGLCFASAPPVNHYVFWEAAQAAGATPKLRLRNKPRHALRPCPWPVLYLPNLRDVPRGPQLSLTTLSWSLVPPVPTWSSPVPLTWAALPQARRRAARASPAVPSAFTLSSPAAQPAQVPSTPPSPPSVSAPHCPRWASPSPVMCPRPHLYRGRWPFGGPGPEPATPACLALGPGCGSAAALPGGGSRSDRSARRCATTGVGAGPAAVVWAWQVEMAEGASGLWLSNTFIIPGKSEGCSPSTRVAPRA